MTSTIDTASVLAAAILFPAELPVLDAQEYAALAGGFLPAWAKAA